MIIECPYCNSKVDCEEKGHVDVYDEHGLAPEKISLVECGVCNSALLGRTEIVPIFEKEKWDWDHLTRLWPDPDGEIDTEIPEIARTSLIEAKVCFKAKAYSSCVVMCGRTLEGVCQDHDTKTKTLAGDLKKLLEDGAIDSRLYEWGEALRKHRNLGAHATTERVTRADANDLLDFCIAICEYIYVLNRKFQRFQDRQKKA